MEKAFPASVWAAWGSPGTWSSILCEELCAGFNGSSLGATWLLSSSVGWFVCKPQCPQTQGIILIKLSRLKTETPIPASRNLTARDGIRKWYPRDWGESWWTFVTFILRFRASMLPLKPVGQIQGKRKLSHKSFVTVLFFFKESWKLVNEVSHILKKSFV